MPSRPLTTLILPSLHAAYSPSDHVRPWANAPPFTGAVTILEDSAKKWVLVLNPTSWRNAYDSCAEQGGRLMPVNSQRKTDALLAAIRVSARVAWTAWR